MKRGFQMVDVGGKTPTRRRALATGSLRMGRAAFALLKSGRLPKGDALALGQAAGILAAKRAPEHIPLCHPLPLERVDVRFLLDANLPGVRAQCEAAAFAKTGVEMEALSGVAAALLAVYDVVKQVDPALTISDVRLEVKEGGKSGVWRHPQSAKRPTMAGHSASKKLGRAAVLTVSDTRSRKTDVGGPLLAQGLRQLGFKTAKPAIVPDDRQKISAAVARLSESHDVVALTGGTGLSPRDVTPEAAAAACDRDIPGFGEALRALGAQKTPLARLSRGGAWLRGRCVVVALPGSPSGVRDGLQVLSELLPHALHVARGGGH